MTKQSEKLKVAMIGHGFMGRAHSNAFCPAGCFFDIPYQLQLKGICAVLRATQLKTWKYHSAGASRSLCSSGRIKAHLQVQTHQQKT
jgi:hypothetical protein